MSRGVRRAIRTLAGVGAITVAAIGLWAQQDHLWLICLLLCAPLIALALWPGAAPGQPLLTRSTGRLAHIVLTLFMVLSLHLVHLQVVSADIIGSRTQRTPQGTVRNPRILEADLAARRGEIFAADGEKIVRQQVLPDGTMRRTYGDPNLTYLVGYYNPIRFGANGLELTYDDALLGRRDADPVRAFSSSLLHQPLQGNDLLLTVVPAVQTRAAAALGNRRGSVVVLDAKTGATIAMVSNPHLDPAGLAPGQPEQSQAYWERLRNDPTSPFVFRPTQGLYTPGSTFKAVTAAAAIDTGKARPETVYEDRGVINIEGFRLIERNIPRGRESQQAFTLSEAFAYSLNVVFAQVAARTLGGPLLADYARRFGFGEPLPFDLPTNTAIISNAPDFLQNAPAVAETGFGQGELLASPLQMATVAAAIANDGRAMEPYLVAGVRRADGTMAEQHAPKVWRTPIRAETAVQMRAMMENSVTTGYANAAAIPGTRVGGKTGSAEVPSGDAHAWFIGYATGKSTTYAIAVIVENGGEGSTVAAPIARQVLEATLAYDAKK